MATDLAAPLGAENAKLLAQAEAMSGDPHVVREAEPWRDATPAERLAATWSLCRDVRWLRSLWPEDVGARADRREPPPAGALDLLERMRRGEGG
ncbi:MAG TPA: hypothetical protein VGQ83_08780 [Polyangia bacterium]